MFNQSVERRRMFIAVNLFEGARLDRGSRRPQTYLHDASSLKKGQEKKKPRVSLDGSRERCPQTIQFHLLHPIF